MFQGISEESFHKKDFQGTLLETKYKRLWEELSRILETWCFSPTYFDLHILWIKNFYLWKIFLNRIKLFSYSETLTPKVIHNPMSFTILLQIYAILLHFHTVITLVIWNVKVLRLKIPFNLQLSSCIGTCFSKGTYLKSHFD